LWAAADVELDFELVLPWPEASAPPPPTASAVAMIAVATFCLSFIVVVSSRASVLPTKPPCPSEERAKNVL
jgi:hypothetical protein